MLLLSQSQLLSPPPSRRIGLHLLRPTSKFPTRTSLKSRNSSSISASAHPLSQTLDSLKPFVVSQREPILRGWLCSLVSVYSLSQIVPRLGKFSNIDAATLKTDGIVLGLLVLARLLAGYWQQAFLWDAAANSAYRIRVHVFEKVLETDLSFFEGARVVPAGDIAYRIASEASDVADTVYALLNTIVPSALQLSTMAGQMLAISPVLSLISALVIPCMSLVVVLLGERLRKISRDAQLSIAALSAYLNEVLPAILFIKANNSELCENVKFQRLAHDDLSKRLEKKKMKALIPQIVQAIYFGVLSIICIGSLAISGGSFDGGSMISFVTSLVLMIEPIQGVGKAYNELKEGQPVIERLFDLTRFRSKVIENPGAVDLDRVAGEVSFCDISFKYGDSTPLVLNGLNLCIKAGETVALVGPSGGGKTTLMKLLLRLYDPLSGCILVDNHDIKSIRLESLRRHIGLVSQDITLFSGTVADNIGYKDLTTKIDMERVKHAAQIANADEFINALPDGYETNIGLRGCVLSGGQKQRLAIARALYQDPTILILDEATSALDSRSELLVRQAVQRLMENRTVLVIAHRLETVLMASRILLLDDGKLEELTRSSLLASTSTGIVI